MTHAIIFLFAGFSGFEILGFIVFGLIVLLHMIAGIRNVLNAEPVQSNIEQTAKKIKGKRKSAPTLPEFTFDYSTKNKIKLLHFGDFAAYASIIGDQVYFFSNKGRKQIHPVIDFDENDDLSIERALKRAFKIWTDGHNIKRNERTDEVDMNIAVKKKSPVQTLRPGDSYSEINF